MYKIHCGGDAYGHLRPTSVSTNIYIRLGCKTLVNSGVIGDRALQENQPVPPAIQMPGNVSVSPAPPPPRHPKIDFVDIIHSRLTQ
jgi:hypothetical protein